MAIRAALVTLALGLPAAGTIRAQAAVRWTAPEPRDTTPAAARSAARAAAGTRPAPLFTLRDAAVAAGFAGATIALFPVDERVAKRLQDPGTQANRFFRDASRGFELVASPGAFLVGGTLYAVGRLGHHERVADLGWHGTEAMLVATAATGVLKGTLGRARPFVSADTSPRDFGVGRGFTKGDDYTSFPSGHTTTAFAAASAVTGEARRWWPEQWWSTWLVGPALYGGATMVGLSRMYHDKHWASDVALGAGVGTLSGLAVVRHQHGHPGNRVDRWLLAATVAPSPDGVALAWSIPLGSPP